jgi:pre-rRNA-processing protein TSR3
MEQKINLQILHLSQDDPKKCTARKLARLGHATLIKRLSLVPYSSILLDPYSEKVISKEDLELVQTHGLLAIDCSWENAEEALQLIRTRKKVVPRALPFMIAVNPVKYGKAFQLSTLEAFAGALIILGYRAQAEDILSIYKWSSNFLVMNNQPLHEYEKAKTSEEIIKAQAEFV